MKNKATHGNKSNIKSINRSRSKKSKMYKGYSLYLFIGVLIILCLLTFVYKSTRVGNDISEYLDNDNLTPEEVAINLVTGGKKLPLSDDPEVNAMRAVDQTVRANIGKKTSEEVDRLAEIEARRAARDTIVSIVNSNGVAYPSSQPIPSIKDRQLDAQDSALNAIDTIKTYFTYGYNEKTKSVIVKKNQICEKGEAGKPSKCRYVSTNYNRVYTNNDNSKLCSVDNGFTFYPVGTAIRTSNDECRICSKNVGYNLKTKTADFVGTNCSEIPTNMILTKGSDGTTNYCPLYKVDNVNQYRLKPLVGEESNYDKVLVPENGKSIIVYSSEAGNPAMELICEDGVMKQVN